MLQRAPLRPFETPAPKSGLPDLGIIMPISGKPEIGAGSSGGGAVASSALINRKSYHWSEIRSID